MTLTWVEKPSLKPEFVGNASRTSQHICYVCLEDVLEAQDPRKSSATRRNTLYAPLSTCPFRYHPLYWMALSLLPPENQETGFCFITAQTFLFQFCSQNPCMFNMLSGISPLNPKWMFYDVQRSILWISKFSLLPRILFKAGVNQVSLIALLYFRD